jgi:hypothetical protein
MKKRDLLFAGLLLLGVPVLAQRTFQLNDKTDPKVIFEQGFEDDWDSWSKDSIDVIDTLWYYANHTSGTSANIWEKPEEFGELVARTDSVIPIYRGNVVKTDSKSDVTNYEKDTYDIITDESQNRRDIFSSYGQDGGSRVFKYVADSNGYKAAWQQNPDNHSPNYRRNLFVRLTPGTIQPNTTYRITYFVKAQDANNGKVSAPRVDTDLMRGYFHSEKPFSMGLQDDADHYKYKTTFEWNKTSFSKDWEKVTYMTHYLNDSIANAFVFVASYYWDGDWTWAKGREGNTTENDLKFIQQPDKFFVRVSFSGDNTEYRFDNLSLMRTNIAGAEYYDQKVRIDFGFKNNIKDLVAEAKKVTGIDAVEVPFDFDTYNFEVWGKSKTTGEWSEIYIRSAEYHSDGYLYMFTDYEVVDGREVFYSFNNYSEIRISFKNPTNPKLQLKYTGTGKDLANAFPNALDTNWIKAGKIIPDLVNEIGTPVPAESFAGVYSMKDLPPILTGVEYEDNEFGLAPVDQFKFGFSRRLAVDKQFLGTNTDNVVALVNNVAWIPSIDPANDTILVITKPNNVPALNGDVEIKLIQLYGGSETGARITGKGENVTKVYNFGDIARSFNVEPVYQTNLADERNQNESVPLGVAKVDKDSKGFAVGTGIKASGSRLYYFAEGGQFTRGMYFSPRSGKLGATYWGVGDYPIRLAKGTYTLSFNAIGWDGTNDVSLYVYPKPDVNANDLADANKTLLGKFKCTNYLTSSQVSKSGETKVTNADAFSFKFNADADTAYIFEFRVTSSGNGNWHGDVISDLIIYDALPVSYAPVTALNGSVDAAKARLALAAADLSLYNGVIYQATLDMATKYEPGGSFDAEHKTKPSIWAKAKSDLDKQTEALKLRMDTVDAFVSQKAAVDTKLTDNEFLYSGLETYVALKDKQSEAESFKAGITRKTGPEIYTFNDEMKAAIQALDDRIALNGKFKTLQTRAKTLISDSANISYEEYAALKVAYATYENYDLIAATDADINANYDELLGAANAYEFRLFGSAAKTVRIKALSALASKLGSDINENAIVKAQMETLDDDDDNLAAVFMSAIKMAIYDKAADDPNAKILDSLNLTPFIKNYNLYQTAKVVDRNNLKANDAGAREPDPDGAQIQYVQHQWNSGDLHGKMPIWVMIQNQEYTDLYPGWTAKAYTDGNGMVTGDKSYEKYKNGIPVFDAMIGMDWNGKAEIWTELTELPVGYYSIGVELTEYKMKNNQWTTLTITTDTTYEYVAKTDGVQIVHIDSIKVDNSTPVGVKLLVRSGDGWTQADNFQMAYRPDLSISADDYEELIDAETTKLSALFTIVDAASAQAKNVEFFNLGGMKVDSPKAGDILIRKSTVGGKVVVDKVMLK